MLISFGSIAMVTCSLDASVFAFVAPASRDVGSFLPQAASKRSSDIVNVVRIVLRFIWRTRILSVQPTNRKAPLVSWLILSTSVRWGAHVIFFEDERNRTHLGIVS